MSAHFWGFARLLVAVRRRARYAAGGARRLRRRLRRSRLQHGDAEGEVSSRCAHVRLSTPIRLGLDLKKSPGFLRGRGLELDSVRPLQSPGLTINPNPERCIWF